MVRRILLAAFAALLSVAPAFAQETTAPATKADPAAADPALKVARDTAQGELKSRPQLFAGVTGVDATNVTLGDPRRVVRLGGDGSNSFYRVPILYKVDAATREIGFFDLTSKEGSFSVTRLSLRIKAAGEASDLPQQVLEMSNAQIISKARTLAGEGLKVTRDPWLVYDGAETKIGWAIEVMAGDAKRTLVVTPQNAYYPNDSK